MVRMRMRKNDGINTRKLGYLYPGSCDTREESAELWVEIWIGENNGISETQEQCRMADVGDVQRVHGIRCC